MWLRKKVRIFSLRKTMVFLFYKTIFNITKIISLKNKTHKTIEIPINFSCSYHIWWSNFIFRLSLYNITEYKFYYYVMMKSNIRGVDDWSNFNRVYLHIPNLLETMLSKTYFWEKLCNWNFFLRKPWIVIVDYK